MDTIKFQEDKFRIILGENGPYRNLYGNLKQPFLLSVNRPGCKNSYTM